MIAIRLPVVLGIFGLAAAFHAAPAAAEVFPGNTSGGPEWFRPEVTGNQQTGILVPYEALPFEVSVSGSYTLITTPLTGQFDIMLFLYDATFAPATPLVGYLAGEDVFINGDPEQIEFSLVSNTTYFAVTTGVIEIDADPFKLSINGPGDVEQVEPPDPSYAAGDFNEDRSVNGDDLVSWRQGFVAIGAKTHMQGDADGDLDTDGDDLLIWQRELNVTFVASPAATSVPEPSGAVLAIGSLSVGCLARRRRRPR